MNRNRQCSPFTAIATLLVVLLTLLLFGKSIQAEEADSLQNEMVILLHGLGRTENSMEKMADSLSVKGFKVVNLGYPSNTFTIEQLSAQYLAPVIELGQREQRTIHFVTHSMGGIIVRHYLSKHPDMNFGRCVMLAPPNHGSEIIDRFGKNSFFQTVMGPASSQLGTSSNSLPNILPPIPIETGIIAGSKSFNPLSSALIENIDDGKVSVESTTVSGMSDHLVLPVTHTFIMRDRIAIEQTGYFLKNGFFKK